MNRRNFLACSASCGAHVLALSMFNPVLTRRVFAQSQDDQIVAKEKWGYVQKLQDNIWAMVSTPFTDRDFTTVCNSGIVAGRDKVLVIEAFMQPEGARWMSEMAFQLTGRRPTDVVCTHYHGDHTSGHTGFRKDKIAPRIWLTASTRKKANATFSEQEKEEFQNVRELAADQPTQIDLGGRTVTIQPRAGHTDSDVTIEIGDPNIVWCGDLFFNRMFPNYGDAKPKLLNDYADQLVKESDTIYVPGHGPVADAKALTQYRDFLKFVEDSATRSFEAGREIDDAVKQFELPDSLKEWFIWSPDVVKRSYNAWYQTLEKGTRK